MSGFITADGENYMLDLFTGSYTPLPTYYFALGRTKPPTRHTTGSEFDEPITADYKRAPYTNASGNWTERVSSVFNVTQIAFPVATSAWGLVKYWAICDAPTGGKLLWVGSFTVPLTVGAGDQVVLAPGQVAMTSSGYRTQVTL